jgi:hypothetical protein
MKKLLILSLLFFVTLGVTSVNSFNSPIDSDITILYCNDEIYPDKTISSCGSGPENLSYKQECSYNSGKIFCIMRHTTVFDSPLVIQGLKPMIVEPTIEIEHKPDYCLPYGYPCEIVNPGMSGYLCFCDGNKPYYIDD